MVEKDLWQDRNPAPKQEPTLAQALRKAQQLLQQQQLAKGPDQHGPQTGEPT
jgi:hypothetical protein